MPKQPPTNSGMIPASASSPSPMTTTGSKIRYDIEKRQSSKGRWKWVWTTKKNGRFATVDEAFRAAKAKNRKEGLLE